MLSANIVLIAYFCVVYCVFVIVYTATDLCIIVALDCIDRFEAVFLFFGMCCITTAE